MADYPTDDDLEAIRTFDVTTRTAREFIDLIRGLWHWGVKDEWVGEDGTLYLATGGWSGNEEIIQALRGNMLFWALAWHSSMRGGAWWFHLQDVPQWKEEFTL